MCTPATHRSAVLLRAGRNSRTAVCQYDEQGRLLRAGNPGCGGMSTNFTTAATRLKAVSGGNRYNASGRVQLRPQDHRNRPAVPAVPITNMDVVRGRRHLSSAARYVAHEDARGNTVKQVQVTDAGGRDEKPVTTEWTYDDAARTATCVDDGGSGTTEKHWYDEQGRWHQECMELIGGRSDDVRLPQHTPMSPAEEVFG